MTEELIYPQEIVFKTQMLFFKLILLGIVIYVSFDQQASGRSVDSNSIMLGGEFIYEVQQ